MSTILKRDDIYPAPPVEEAFPPTESTLRAIALRDGETAAVSFALGNVLIRALRFEEAIDEYRKALALGGPPIELNTNLGVAYFLQGRFDEALRSFRQAMFHQGTQPQVVVALPHLFAAKAMFELGDDEGALTALDRVIRMDLRTGEAYLLQAKIHERQGDNERALESYRRVHEIDPQTEGVQQALAWSDFRRGEERFRTGDRFSAFSIWHEAHIRYYPTFLVDHRVAAALTAIARADERQDELRLELSELRSVLVSGVGEPAPCFHRVVATFLLTVGLIPDCYEILERLDEETSRWRRSIDEQGEHPYPHFRLALLAMYRGDLSVADSELRHCHDHLPAKKRLSLKLAEILVFLEELRELVRVAQEEARGRSPDWEWDEAGFDNRFERETWRRAGFQPAEARAWRELNFSAIQAKNWRHERLTPEHAAAWNGAGCSDPRDARRWSRGGFSPDDSKQWSVLFADRIEEAVQCRSVGLDDPTIAAEWLKICRFPWDAAQWSELGFTPQEASYWIDRGISDPFRARDRAKHAAETSAELSIAKQMSSDSAQTHGVPDAAGGAAAGASAGDSASSSESPSGGAIGGPSNADKG